MENEIINKKILNIWEKHPKYRGINSPLLYPKFKNNCILFIGCNPAMHKKRDETARIEAKLNDLKYLIYNELKKDKKNKIDSIIKHENAAKINNPYFKKFKAISKEINLDWQDIDLFYYRITSQNDLQKVIGFKEDKIGNIYFNEFGEDQLKLLLYILSAINPKVIVVANSFVSKIINNRFEEMMVKPSNFEKEGFDRILINNKKIPIFFTSMLTGQRAFDNHSYKRLIWHIKIAIK